MKYELSPERQCANKIISKLNEKKGHAPLLIRAIVQHKGIEFAEAMLEETIAIEAAGGQMVEYKGEERRRTPGGVFFRLVKERVSDEERKAIFYPPKKKQPAKGEMPKDAPEAAVPGKIEIPVDTSDMSELEKLEHTATKLRARIAQMEALPKKQQKNLSMTQRLLKNTERQIEQMKQVSE